MSVNHQLSMGCLTVRIFDSRADMGAYAAHDIACGIRDVLSRKECCNMVFAAAPSQNEALAGLRAAQVDFSRVNAFHMDEYVGLAQGAPQSFGRFLREALFDRVPMRSVHCIAGWQPDTDAECARYSALLRRFPTDIVVMGIGENGHIAFNDPHEADFDDPALVKRVSLDETCRMQQVHDGCFASLCDVPTHALTLTVPALAAAPLHYCVVPAASKAEAVRRTLTGPIGPECPATILRRCPNSIVYLDGDSSSLL